MAYKGEVRLIAGTYAPAGWTMCTGGSGIPDLRGRVVIHAHAAAPLGEMGGAETVPLIAAELPVHRHVAMCAGDAITSTPVQGFWAAITTKKFGTLCRSACRSGYDGVVLYHAGG